MEMYDPAHPGEVLLVTIVEDRGVSVSELARCLGVSRVTLSRFLHAKTALTPVLALRLEKAGLGDATTWLDLQSAYDLARERRKSAEILKGVYTVSFD